MLTLDIAVSTCRPEGIRRVESMVLPPQRGVRYVVSWQDHSDCPVPQSLESREDVVVVKTESKGLSNNRNNSIENCKADLILIADDDVSYTPDAFRQIINSFEENPSIDMAFFRVDLHVKKNYPADGSKIEVPFPRNYYVNSVEIAFRRNSIEELRFYPELGLGAPEMHSGEEELFVISAIKRGLECRFINKLIGSHPYVSSGEKTTPGILKGSGYIITILYPFQYIPRLVLKAWRISSEKGPRFFKALSCLVSGSRRAKREFRDLPHRYWW